MANNTNPLVRKMVINFEPSNSNMLDDDLSFCNMVDDDDSNFSNVRGGGGGFGGGRGGFGGGRPMGAGFAPRVAPAVAPRIVAPAVAPTVAPVVARTPRTAQQRHTGMVKRFYRNNPYGGNFGRRRFGFTNYGRRWWLGGTGYLFGYPYDFLYPLFFDLDSGVYDEYYLRQKYNLSDAQWDELINKLVSGNYISFNY